VVMVFAITMVGKAHHSLNMNMKSEVKWFIYND